MQRRNSARRHFSDTALFGRIHAPLMPPGHKVLVITCMDIGYVIFSYGDLGLAKLSATDPIVPLETVFKTLGKPPIRFPVALPQHLLDRPASRTPRIHLFPSRPATATVRYRCCDATLPPILARISC